jgi:hypothetical protein
MRDQMKILTLLALLTMFSEVAYAEITQDPIPTREEVTAQIDPAVRDIKDATPWELFAGTTFERKKFHDDEYKMDYFVETPIFDDAVKALDGKEITVKGYMNIYQLQATHKEFLLAAIPMEGEGHYDGPGSLVLEVHPAEPEEYAPGIVTYKGRLELVPGKLKARGIYFRLRDAVKVK